MGTRVSSPRIRKVETAHNPGLERRWLTYALGAAGVIALTPVVNASIVYTQTNVTISQGILPIDLDQDGKADFALHNYWVGSSSSVQAITVRGNPLNSQAAVIGHKQGIFEFVNPVASNYSIGSAATKFVNVEGNRAYLSNTITNKFLGLRFAINGQTHYGWARISSRGNGTTRLRTIRLSGFAYETTPNKAILAGDEGPSAKAGDESSQGSSLAMLSLGAPGLDIWRRKATS